MFLFNSCVMVIGVTERRKHGLCLRSVGYVTLDESLDLWNFSYRNFTSPEKCCSVTGLKSGISQSVRSAGMLLPG